MTNAFVYSWSDHKTAKVYVGVHKGHEKDGYVCSSKGMKKAPPSEETRLKLSESIKLSWKKRKGIL